MAFTFHINDTSNPKAKAFLEYIKTLEFVVMDKDDEVLLDQEQIQAIDQARDSLKKNGGKSHQEVMDKMKTKYPKAFRA